MESVIATGMEAEPFLLVILLDGKVSEYRYVTVKVSLYDPHKEGLRVSGWRYFSEYDLEVR
jgi:hypothetical protein